MDQYDCYGKAASAAEDMVLLSGRYSFQEHLIPLIVDDIVKKMHVSSNHSFLEVGSGAGNLTIPLSKYVNQMSACDHPFLLDKLLTRSSDLDNINTYPGNFFDVQFTEKFDRVLVYSVIHCLDSLELISLFIEKALSLLSANGLLLIGDIPNVSLKQRFLSSSNGQIFDQKWKSQITQSTQNPANYLEIKSVNSVVPLINDCFLERIKQNFNHKNYNVYYLPQPACLPFGFTREDLVICHPGYNLN